MPNLIRSLALGILVASAVPGVAYADGCAATSLCTVRAFFCSDEHLASWRETEHPDGKGFRLSMDEGLQTGVAIFAPLLAPASSETS